MIGFVVDCLHSLHFNTCFCHSMVFLFNQLVYFFLKLFSLDQVSPNLTYDSPIWHFWLPLIVTFVLAKNLEMLGQHRRRKPIFFYDLLIFNFLENFARLQHAVILHLFNSFLLKNSKLVSHIGNLVSRDSLCQIVLGSIFE